MLHFNAPNCLLSTKVILPKEISNIAVISIVKKVLSGNMVSKKMRKKKASRCTCTQREQRMGKVR